MSRNTLAALAVLLALLLAGVGAAYYAGIGPAPGGDEAQLTDYPTGTPINTGTGGGRSATDTATPPFSFDIVRIEECGRTCRDVTASLNNQQDEPATGVEVLTRIYAGRDNTAEEDRVWSGEESVGTLEAGATHTATKRVELSLQEAFAVENNGGWVTVVTTVRTDDRTLTYKRSRQVA